MLKSIGSLVIAGMIGSAATLGVQMWLTSSAQAQAQAQAPGNLDHIARYFYKARHCWLETSNALSNDDVHWAAMIEQIQKLNHTASWIRQDGVENRIISDRILCAVDDMAAGCPAKAAIR